MTIKYTDFQAHADIRIRERQAHLAPTISPFRASHVTNLDALMVVEFSLVPMAYKVDARSYCLLAWWYWYLVAIGDAHAECDKMLHFGIKCILFGMVAVFIGELRGAPGWMCVGVIVAFYGVFLASVQRGRMDERIRAIEAHVASFQEEYACATLVNKIAIQRLSAAQPKWFREKLFAPRPKALVAEKAT